MLAFSMSPCYLSCMGKDLKKKELGKGLCQRQDGYFVARFTAQNGERITKVFKRLPDARIWLRDASYDDAHTVRPKVKDVTVNSWFTYWMNEIMYYRLKYNTRASYNRQYKNRIDPLIGHMLLNEIKPLDCQAVMNYCMKKQDVSDSISKVRSIMKNMFEAAIENELMVTNPVTTSVKYKREKRVERRVFTVEEQKKFKELASESSYKDVFFFILNTGLRVGELSALKWSDVDFNKNTIKVGNTAFYNDEIGEMDENSPKTDAGYRTIPLTTEAQKILKEHFSSRQTNDIYVFYNSYHSQIRESDVNKALKRIVVKKMGITDKFTPHSLRHTFATRCAESGMKPKVLQKILGHENISTTMNLYVHATEDEMTNEIEKLNNII